MALVGFVSQNPRRIARDLSLDGLDGLCSFKPSKRQNSRHLLDRQLLRLPGFAGPSLVRSVRFSNCVPPRADHPSDPQSVLRRPATHRLRRPALRPSGIESHRGSARLLSSCAILCSRFATRVSRAGQNRAVKRIAQLRQHTRLSRSQSPPYRVPSWKNILAHLISLLDPVLPS
jgi:hypothetical protein